MIGRRALLSKLSSALVAGGVVSESQQAASGAVSQNQQAGEAALDIRVNNQATLYLNVGSNTPELDFFDSFAYGGGLSLTIDETDDGVNTDARTTFEDVIQIQNTGVKDVTFMLRDDGAGVGSGSPVDFLLDGETVVGTESEFDSVGVSLAENETVSLTVEIDFMDHEPVALIDGIVTAIIEDDSFCFITTATAGESPALDSLRRFRDDSMKATSVGRGLVNLYYQISPPIAATLARHSDGLTARAVRWLVHQCATLSDRKAETDSTTVSTVLGGSLTLLYVVGCLVAGAGHLLIRGRERLSSGR